MKIKTFGRFKKKIIRYLEIHTCFPEWCLQMHGEVGRQANAESCVYAPPRRAPHESTLLILRWSQIRQVTKWKGFIIISRLYISIKMFWKVILFIMPDSWEPCPRPWIKVYSHRWYFISGCYFPVRIWGYSDDSWDGFPRNHLFPQALDKIKPDI